MAFGRPCRGITERGRAEKEDTEFQKVGATVGKRWPLVSCRQLWGTGTGADDSNAQLSSAAVVPDGTQKDLGIYWYAGSAT
jgi:hypothetical protein